MYSLVLVSDEGDLFISLDLLQFNKTEDTGIQQKSCQLVQIFWVSP